MKRALAVIGYVLLRILRWPVTWYFRPLDLLPGLQDPKRRWLELAGSVLGGGLWIGLLGFMILRIWGASESPLMLVMTFGVVGAGAVAFTVTVAVADADAGADAFAFAVLVAGTGAFAFAGAVVGAGARGLLLISSYAVLTWTFLVSLTMSFFLGRTNAKSQKKIASIGFRPGSSNLLLMMVWFGAFFANFLLFARPTVLEKPTKIVLERPYSFLALAAAALATDLPFYPLLALVQVWQCRRSRARQFHLDDIDRLMASRWQSFAYPLPGIRRYLCDVGRWHGVELALKAVRKLQGSTLQTTVTSRAVLDLARDQELGLAFTTHVAAETNPETLMSLALSSRLSAILAIIAGAAGK
jgi:hypothetical protein